jgi:hypothetical protein
MTDSAAVLLGATISSLVAIAVVALQQSLNRREQQRQARAERLGNFAAVAWSATDVIGVMARTPMAAKELAGPDQDRGRQIFETFHARLSLIQLLEDPKVVEAAEAVDQAIALHSRLSLAQHLTRDEWRTARVPLREAIGAFRLVARRTLRRRSWF